MLRQFIKYRIITKRVVKAGRIDNVVKPLW
jgi:hypothetical protein